MFSDEESNIIIHCNTHQSQFKDIIKKSKENKTNEFVESLNADIHEILVENVFLLIEEAIVDLNAESECVYSALFLLHAFIKRSCSSRKLTDTVLLLNSVLLQFNDSNLRVQNCCSRLLEKWWTYEQDKRIELVKSVPAYLLALAVSQPRKGDAVKRLYNVKEMFAAIDFSTPDSTSLLMLLGSAMTCHHILTNNLGADLLTYVLSLNETVMLFLDETIKTSITSLRDPQLTSLGKIYGKLLVDTNGTDMGNIFQARCIQNMADSAIHCLRQGPLKAAPLFQKILVTMHRSVKTKEVQDVFCNLYAPLLWKALDYPNGDIRANATALFVQSFPLIPHSLSKIEFEKVMEERCSKLMELLLDNNAAVREIAAKNVGVIMDKNWNILPSYHISEFLKITCEELPFDGGSPKVVVAALQSIRTVINNSHSHLMLKKYLPQLSELIHHPSQIIRSSFIALLKIVHQTKLIKIWDIVPVESLLNVLGSTKSGEMQKRIVRLLKPVLFPVEDDVMSQIANTLTKICASGHDTYRVFFLHIYPLIGLTTTITFVEAMLKTVKEIVVNGKVTIDKNSESIRLKNDDKILYLLDISALLLHSAFNDIMGCQKSTELVNEAIAPLMPGLLLQFSRQENHLDAISVIICSLPDEGLKSIKKSCFKIFNNSHASHLSKISSSKALIRIGGVRKVMSSILSHITKRFGMVANTDETLDFNVLEIYESGGMVDMLAELISDENRDLVLECEGITDIYDKLELSFSLLSTIARQKKVRQDDVKFLCRCICVYGRLTIHMGGVVDIIKMAECVLDAITQCGTQIRSLVLDNALSILVEGYLILQYDERFLSILYNIFIILTPPEICTTYRLSCAKFIYKTGIFEAKQEPSDKIQANVLLMMFLEHVAVCHELRLEDVQSLILELVVLSTKHRLVDAKRQPWQNVMTIILDSVKKALLAVTPPQENPETENTSPEKGNSDNQNTVGNEENMDKDAKTEEDAGVFVRQLNGFLNMILKCNKYSVTFNEAFVKEWSSSPHTILENQFFNVIMLQQ